MMCLSLKLCSSAWLDSGWKYELLPRLRILTQVNVEKTEGDTTPNVNVTKLVLEGTDNCCSRRKTNHLF